MVGTMVNYLIDVKPLEDQGVDDATIASHISSRTDMPIPCAETKIILEGNQVIVEDPVTQARTGSLIDHYQSLPDGNEKSLLAWFISHVMGRGVQISSQDYPRSVELAIVVNGLPAEIQSTAAEIIELGGGQPDAGTQEADVIASRNDYNAGLAEQSRVDSINALKAEIENNYINPAVSDGTSTEAQVRAAIKAGL